MIFVYFLVLCIVLSLISWFIVPLIEKNESLINTVKNIAKNIESFILGVFVIYSIFAVILITTELINEWLNIKNGGIIALIIVIICGYRLIQRYNKD